ncbi:class I SAM-dependent methyltransferase [Bacteroidota bacterium]
MRQNNKEHWDKVYSRNADQDVGWYQESPITSIRLIEKYAVSKSDSIIDIGAGNSNLCRELVVLGYSNLTILELSASGIERSKSKAHSISNKITFIEGNVLNEELCGPFNIWHDRAVFHFLWEESEIQAYLKQLTTHVSKDGIFILGAFAENGPELCSGLPVNRQNPDKLKKTFEPTFRILESIFETHITPKGNQQEFLFSVFARN